MSSLEKGVLPKEHSKAMRLAEAVFLAIIFFVFTVAPVARGDWISDPHAGSVGWYGYEKYEKQAKRKNEKKRTVKKKKARRVLVKWPSPEELARMYPDEIQKWIRKAEAEAIREPSEANVKRWLEYVTVAQRKATQFAGMWAWVVQTNPEFAVEAAGSGLNEPARVALARERLLLRRRVVDEACNRYALLVFLDDSDLSLAQKKIMDLFMDDHECWDVRFFLYGRDNDIFRSLGVSFAPQVWLLSRRLQKAVPLAVGPTAEDMLEERIAETVMVLEGKKPPTAPGFWPVIRRQISVP